MYSIILALPVILTRQAHWTSSHIGLVLTALSAVSVTCTPFGGRLADRYGRRAPVVGGLTLFTLALLPLLREAPGWSGLVLTLSLAVAGAGLGIANPGMQTAAVEAVTAREAGAASEDFLLLLRHDRLRLPVRVHFSDRERRSNQLSGD